MFRGLDPDAAKDWARLSGTRFFPELVAEGKAVRTEEVDASSLPSGAGSYAAVLEHERIPYISYPYEWTFEMLRDAAVLHLEILLAALDEDVTMKDGYAFNMQWRGRRTGVHRHRLVRSVQAVGRGSATGSSARRSSTRCCSRPISASRSSGILLGHLDGLDPTEMRRIFSGRKRFKKGVFRHVYLHSVAESRVTQGGQKIKDDLTQSGFGKELTKATVTKLLKLVRKLRSKRADSGWKAYRDTCSYSDDDRVAKERFLRAALEGTDVTLAWDLGCNDGAYSRIVAEHGALRRGRRLRRRHRRRALPRRCARMAPRTSFRW